MLTCSGTRTLRVAAARPKRRRFDCRTRAESKSRLRPPVRRDVETTTHRQDEDALLAQQWLKGDVEGVRQISQTEIHPVKGPELQILDGPPKGNYRTFAFHEDVDFHVEQNHDGQFNLAQAFLFDRAASVYAKPLVSDDVPDAFQSYQVLEWDTWISGDVCVGEEETTQLHKVFFLKQLPLQDERTYPDVDFSELYCIHGEKRTVDKTHVYDLTNKRTVDPVLCIREGNVVIQDSRDCTTPEGYAVLGDMIDYLNKQDAAAEEWRSDAVDLMQEAGVAMEEGPLGEEPDLPEADLL